MKQIYRLSCVQAPFRCLIFMQRVLMLDLRSHVRFKIGDDEMVPFILNSDLVTTFHNMSILDVRPISSIFYDDKLCPSICVSLFT